MDHFKKIIMGTVNEDIKSVIKKDKKEVVYAKAGDKVSIVYDYDDILIVEHDRTKERFTIHKENYKP